LRRRPWVSLEETCIPVLVVEEMPPHYKGATRKVGTISREGTSTGGAKKARAVDAGEGNGAFLMLGPPYELFELCGRGASQSLGASQRSFKGFGSRIKRREKGGATRLLRGKSKVKAEPFIKRRVG